MFGASRSARQQDERVPAHQSSACSAPETCLITTAKSGRIRIALVYPNSYYVGMSNLGLQVVYRILNASEDIIAERCFLPDFTTRSGLRRADRPLQSCESGRTLETFHVIAFSLSFENDFINVLTMLRRARLPLKQADRSAAHPLIIGGGIAASLNPEPLADFFDLFIIGEAEEILPEFLTRLKGQQPARGWRKPPLSAFASLAGVYVPSAYAVTHTPEGLIKARESEAPFPPVVQRRWVPDLNPYPPSSCLIARDTAFSETALVEISRGCPRRCRFCVSSTAYRPFRTRDVAVILSSVHSVMLAGHRLGVLGAAVGDHPGLPALVRTISDQGHSATIASLRADALTPELITMLKACGHKTFTIAPEAGSERLRAAIAKHLSTADILQAVRMMAAQGIASIRLYFMVGLPTETDTDIRAIMALTREIKHAYAQEARGLRRLHQITLSISPFVPKPVTALQWHPFEQLSHIKRKLKAIHSGLSKESKVTVTHDMPKWGYIQALLSQGDRRVGSILMQACQDGGWSRALQSTSVNPDFYVYRAKAFTEALPWDFIDHGTARRSLWDEYQRALRGDESTQVPED